MDPRPAGKPKPWRWPPSTFRDTKRLVSAIAWVIHLDGGELEHESGRCASLVASRLEARGFAPPSAHTLRTSLVSMDTGRLAGLIERDTIATRTYSIRLQVDPNDLGPNPFAAAITGKRDDEGEKKVREMMGLRPMEAVYGTEANGNGHPPTEAHQSPPDAPQSPSGPTPVLPLPEHAKGAPVPATLPAPAHAAADLAEDANPLDLLLQIQSTATAAILSLAAVAHRFEPGDPATESTAARRLADALEENQRLRRKLAEAVETATARAAENQALRKSLMATKANLDALLQGAKVDDSGFRTLRNLMAEKPNQGVRT